MWKLPAPACALALVCLLFAGCAGSPQARRDRFVARGKQYLDKGDPGRALLEFRNAAKAVNNDAEVFYQMGVAYQKTQDLVAAVASFKKALAIDPKHAAAQLRMAELMAAASDPSILQDARGRLRTILENSPPTAEALDVLAIAEIKLGNPEAAARTLERSMDQFPGQLTSAVLLARAKWELKDLKGAEQALKRACQEVPKSAAARQILGQFYLTQNRLPEAEAELRLALQLDPKSASALAALADLQLARNDREEAKKTYQQLSAFPGYHAALGLYLFRSGNPEEALREFERVARENPDDQQLRTYLVAAYHSLKRTTDVDRVLAQALKKNPKDSVALEQRAEVFLERGDFAAAEADLNAAARFLPSAPELHYLRAQLYRLRGAPRSYRQELAETLRLAPTALPVRIELASSLIDEKDGKAALDVLDAAVNSQKTSLPFLEARNWALWTVGNLAEMRKGIDAGLALRRTPELLIQDGLWKWRSGNAAAAQPPLEEALKAAPGDALALEILNATYVARNSRVQGLAKVKEYAARAPQAAPVQIYLGRQLLANGDLKQARSSFLAAKSADPKSLLADLALTQVDYQERKYDDARTRLTAVLSANPGDVTALLWLGIVEQAVGDRPAAIGYYRKVLASDPDESQACNNVAYLLAEQGSNLDEALKYAQRAVELAPLTPAYSDTLGWILYRKGLYTSAVKYLEQASAHPQDVVWKYHLAMAYAKAGDRPHSQAALEAALRANPDVPEAKLAREVVGPSH
jgi:tetratricopeptide (TPR) repeat protein